MEQHLNKQWLLLLRQPVFQPLLVDLAQAVPEILVQEDQVTQAVP